MPNASMRPPIGPATDLCRDREHGIRGARYRARFSAAAATEGFKGHRGLPCFPEVVIRIRTHWAGPEHDHRKDGRHRRQRTSSGGTTAANGQLGCVSISGKRLTDLRSAITRLGQQLGAKRAVAYAVQQMKQAEALRSIAKPLGEL